MNELAYHSDNSLHVKPELQAEQRRVKAINGNILLALYLVPGMPIFGNISLFLLDRTGPKFICYIYAEHWEDDGFLSFKLDTYFKSNKL